MKQLSSEGVRHCGPTLVPERMKAWVPGDPNELNLIDKDVPVSGRAEAPVRINAVAIHVH